MKKQGFTLIELLVVVTIILTLAVTGAVSYRAIQKKGRDNKRKADLEQARAALEMFHTDNDLYPSGSSWAGMISELRADGYLNSGPEDPRADDGYAYEYSSADGSTYSLFACLEAETGSAGGTCCNGGVCNYQVNNP